jgi:hypothetical protein
LPVPTLASEVPTSAGPLGPSMSVRISLPSLVGLLVVAFPMRALPGLRFEQGFVTKKGKFCRVLASVK